MFCLPHFQSGHNNDGDDGDDGCEDGGGDDDGDPSQELWED